MKEKIKNPIEIIKEYLPDISDEEANEILWCYTRWPNFIPNGVDTEEYLREQLRKELVK
jgi:hypothetical protein